MKILAACLSLTIACLTSTRANADDVDWSFEKRISDVEKRVDKLEKQVAAMTKVGTTKTASSLVTYQQVCENGVCRIVPVQSFGSATGGNCTPDCPCVDCGSSSQMRGTQSYQSSYTTTGRSGPLRRLFDRLSNR